MLLLSEKEVASLIDVDELIAALEQAHVQYSTGKAVMPVRLVVPLAQIQGRITSMPGYLNEDKALGMKVVTYFQDNPKRGLPAILATIMLFSSETGKMIAAMDGTYITTIRTACASAMATKVLANAQAPELGILGAGVQARAHIEALARVRKLERIKIYSPSGTSAAKIKSEMERQVGVPIEVAASAEAAVREVDLLVTVTTAKEPIVKAEWLKPGVHINAVGSHRPDLRELDGATLAQSKVVVDSREAIMGECGDILLALKEKSVGENVIHGEIGEVLAGAKAARAKASEITIYKSVGIAIQDVATAQLVYRKALESKTGTNVEI
ncbi:MAG: ornithine cyclodeaminase family protein [Deltaproteobacteria bacterium]|nr:ornithine cyclodeaminase family protein [Deltaproteobacteria bacterium]MBM4296904.1 ornithine cyclodeaminase family protein [Deltaproteobacteria bacterium]